MRAERIDIRLADPPGIAGDPCQTCGEWLGREVPRKAYCMAYMGEEREPKLVCLDCLDVIAKTDWCVL